GARPGAEAAAGAGGCEDHQRHRRRALLRGADAGRSPFRRAKAHARPQGARLPGVGRSLPATCSQPLGPRPLAVPWSSPRPCSRSSPPRSAQGPSRTRVGFSRWNLNATRGFTLPTRSTDAMRNYLRANGTATVPLAAVGAFTLLSLPPSAAQPASRKAVGEDSAPAQAIPPPSTEAPGETRKLGSVLGIEVRTNTEQNVG